MLVHSRISLVPHLLIIASAILLFSLTAFAAPAITLTKRTGPPTTQILVSGTGFAPNVGVDIYFDTTHEALVATDANGNFHHAAIQTPRSAVPGKHWVSALERNNKTGDQEPFLVNTNWPQFNFSPEHTGFNPYENVISPSNVGNLTLRWKFTTTQQVRGYPTVANGILYDGSDEGYSGYLYALNASTGVPLWTYKRDGLAGGAAIGDGVAYLAQGILVALDAFSGATIWVDPSHLAQDNSLPVLVDQTIYLATHENYVAAVDADTGQELWSFATQSFAGFPTYSDGVVYVGSDSGDNNIYALDAKTGEKIWNYTTGNGVVYAPTVVNGVVYVGSFDLHFYALDAKTGTLLWKRPVYACSSSAVADGIVYVGVCSNGEHAMDARTGAPLWNFVNFGSGSEPAVANGVVYFTTRDTNVYAVDAHTGALLWTYATGAAVTSDVAVSNGIIYTGSQDDSMYAFSLPGQDRIGLKGPPKLETLHPDLMLQPLPAENN